jgi:carbamate kinase
MKVVITLGSNALLKRGEQMEAKVQRQNVAEAAAALAPIARAHKVVLTHGSGPQGGMLALKAEAYAESQRYPLDALTAETGGLIGYMIQQELATLLPSHSVVTLLTRVMVSENDPAFKVPARPIGPAYDSAEAQRMEKDYGWTMVPEGLKWRRVVPSPEPVGILELASIRLLLAAGTVVVCAGGGGIPVVRSPKGGVRGVEAVIDKDLVAALLARRIGADALLLLTDVDAAYRGWGEKSPRPIRETMPSELRKYPFAPGSMKPKVEAACRFVEASGKFAGIGQLKDADAILYGLKGTIVRATGVTLDFVPRPGPPGT